LNKTHLTGFQNPTSMRLHQRPQIGEENIPVQEMSLTKAIHEPFPPTQQKDDEVSFFPFQDFGDTLFHDSENEGEMEALNKVLCCRIEDEGEMTHVEDTQALRDPAQEETVSYPPPRDFDDFLLYDEGDKEVVNEVSNLSNPACYDIDTDIVDNIDEFISCALIFLYLQVLVLKHSSF
jgi:hypothetical protein